MRWAGALLASAAAVLCHLNALSADFAFDDHFALTYNGDVTDAAKPLAALWRNDFWGQDIRGEGSHKSYRPLTVLTFRLNRVLSGSTDKLQPWGFHAANVGLHAAVAAAVHALAWRIGRLRGETRPQLHATLTALLFAMHPVHTEAVTGVVGRAELLSALLCIIGLLLYMSSVDSGAPLVSPRCGGAALAALTCAAAAMTAKETGFTILAAFVLYEFLHLGTPLAAPARAGAQHRNNWLKCALRLLATFALAFGYLAARSAIIGGDTLVHIYRKVENPLAFYPSLQQRLLSTVHQHWLYWQLLLAPVQLSADWSFSCIKPVVLISDLRNGGALLLYGFAAAVVLQAAPWRWSRDEQLKSSRVRAYTFLALSVAPFVPAANIFFYVGTFIGERLLYMPSLGFCLLLSELLTATIGEGTSLSSAPLKKVRRLLGTLATAALLTAYGARTWLRNADWATEETLFVAAMRVCPDSAKVRLNSGILARRYENWTGAIAHFRRAEEIEPSYCEPTYWIGLTKVNQNKLDEGMQLLIQALDCKWVAVEAAKVLQQVIAARLKAQPTDAKAILAEGELLTRVGQLERACDAFGRAASILEQQGKARQAKAARARCDASVSDINSCNALVEEHRARLAKATSAAERTSAVHADDDDEEFRGVRSALARNFIAAAGTRCRSSSQAYLEAINHLQRIDAYDPYLHREWALALRARGGRDAESLQHLSVAASLFEQALSALSAGHAVEGPQMLPGGDELTLGALRRELAATRALLPQPPSPGAKRRGDEL